MQFGASIWPFQWTPPYESGIERLAKLGFKHTELIAWDAAALSDYYTPARIASLKKLLGDVGMGLSEFVHSPRGAADRDPAVRRAGIETFRRAADVAKELGTDIINSVVPTPFGLPMPRMQDMPLTQELSVDLPAGLNWADGYAWYIDSLTQLTQICEKTGLKYALETHPHRWASTAIGLLRLFDHVKSPALGANFDPSHLFPCGDLPQVAVYELGNKVFHCHFSDNDGASNAHWRPGRGKIDWGQTLVALKNVGFDGVISIELEDVPGRANNRMVTAEPVFDFENTESMRYLREVAWQNNVTLM
ncbi:MAG: sugar phosphate isomerase/epimerase [Chloroflexota bacterium]|nr:MAG: sugar phosphate isomerase/epimerase [Chloroflexota bacterium]